MTEYLMEAVKRSHKYPLMFAAIVEVHWGYFCVDVCGECKLRYLIRI